MNSSFLFVFPFSTVGQVHQYCHCEDSLHVFKIFCKCLTCTEIWKSDLCIQHLMLLSSSVTWKLLCFICMAVCILYCIGVNLCVM